MADNKYIPNECLDSSACAVKEICDTPSGHCHLCTDMCEPGHLKLHERECSESCPILSAKAVTAPIVSLQERSVNTTDSSSPGWFMIITIICLAVIIVVLALYVLLWRRHRQQKRRNNENAAYSECHQVDESRDSHVREVSRNTSQSFRPVITSKTENESLHSLHNQEHCITPDQKPIESTGTQNTEFENILYEENQFAVNCTGEETRAHPLVSNQQGNLVKATPSIESAQSVRDDRDIANESIPVKAREGNALHDIGDNGTSTPASWIELRSNPSIESNNGETDLKNRETSPLNLRPSMSGCDDDGHGASLLTNNKSLARSEKSDSVLSESFYKSITSVPSERHSNDANILNDRVFHPSDEVSHEENQASALVMNDSSSVHNSPAIGQNVMNDALPTSYLQNGPRRLMADERGAVNPNPDRQANVPEVNYHNPGNEYDSYTGQGITPEDLAMFEEAETHPDRQTFETMKQFDWVQGFSSEGHSIEVYVDGAMINQHQALADLVAATNELPTKFKIIMEE